MECEEVGVHPRFVLHDRDGLFIHSFDDTLKGAGVEVVKTPFRAPNANSHAERRVLSAKQECLDPLVLFGLENLRRTVACYRVFHNELRPHQGLGQRIPIHVNRRPTPSAGGPPKPVVGRAGIVCTPFLGGLLKAYSRKAA
jgi:hypothetical protein